MEIFFYIIFFIALYTQVFFLMIFFENRNVLEHIPVRRKDLKRFPSVTIIVPCWNEEVTLPITIDSLLALDYPKEKLDILIVNDGSTDNTLDVAYSLEKKHKHIKVLTKENGGKHTAINLALLQTKTELVGCLDADSHVEKGALLEIVKIFEDENVKTVTPAIKIDKPKSIIQRIQRVEYNMSVYLRKMFALLGAVQVTPGPFSIFRRSVFEDLGAYRKAHNTEDMEMALRLHLNHYKIENAHHAYVYTKGPRTFRALHKQRVRWVYGYLMNTIDYRKMLFNPKYGHVGMIVLPGGVFGVVSAFYFLFIFFWNLSNTISQKVIEVQTVGWQWNFHVSHFTWFSVPTTWSTFVIFFLVLISIFVAFLGMRMSEKSWKPTVDMFFFLAFYGYISFTWMTRAVYNVAFARGKESWH